MTLDHAFKVKSENMIQDLPNVVRWVQRYSPIIYNAKSIMIKKRIMNVKINTRFNCTWTNKIIRTFGGCKSKLMKTIHFDNSHDKHDITSFSFLFFCRVHFFSISACPLCSEGSWLYSICHKCICQAYICYLVPFCNF